VEGLRRVALFEVAAMIALLLSYIWLWQRTFTGAFHVVLVMYFAIGVAGHFLRRESPREIGFRLDNTYRALLSAGVYVVPAIAVTVLVGFALDSWHFPSWRRTLTGAPWLYAWALAQQYGLICVLYRRSNEILGSDSAATAIASAAFAMFHLPNPFLVAVTLAAGVVACRLYRREPNIFVISLAHAMISFVLLCSLPLSVTHGLRVGPGYFVLP
jgi:membrane protease YdiL (CAAX protease family)